jgi:hypothetical protein
MMGASGKCDLPSLGYRRLPVISTPIPILGSVGLRLKLAAKTAAVPDEDIKPTPQARFLAGLVELKVDFLRRGPWSRLLPKAVGRTYRMKGS